MSDGRTSSSLLVKISFSLGAIIFSYAAVKYSGITIFAGMIPGMRTSRLFPEFEHHFWQFIFSFLAIGLLSRGHLWSYGISSKNLKTSMYWLALLYLTTASMSALFFLLGGNIQPPVIDGLHHPIRETLFAMLIYWMSSPVSNQLLFFGLVQTVLMKQWGETIKFAGVPAVVFVSVIPYMLWSTSAGISAGAAMIFFSAVLGIFCGMVYLKTGSLLTPMLGQAFYFGFPILIQMIK